MTMLLLAGLFLVPGGMEMVDYAAGTHCESWLRHPVLGDPSFDSFTRSPANPVLRGEPPHEWPVNGFLFEDPASGDWFLYAGRYLRGYALLAEHPSHCLVMRSGDRGRHWERVGEALPMNTHVFAGESSPMGHAPDVSVVYDGGRYHMAYDWTTANTSWENVFDPPADVNSGVGYAWSETPAGPFHPAAVPVVTTRNQTPLLGKYRRMYASTILRRANDWLILTLTDSGANFGWALAGMTAKEPEGPWTEPVLLLHPERAAWHPPLLEFFPSFVHEGRVYAPATSVARNRNYQALFSAPLENAMDPSAWELSQAGSVWHAEPVEWEDKGIWGQAFSGFVDRDGVFQVMFPSRDRDGFGTLNLASRPWDRPYRERGFVLSGHEGPSITLLKHGVALRALQAEFTLRGSATLFWNYHGVLDSDRVSSDSIPHAHTLAGYTGLEMDDTGWRLVTVDGVGENAILASGANPVQGEHAVSLAWENGHLSFLLDGASVWSGEMAAPSGLLGLLAQKQSHLEVDRFVVGGTPQPATITWGWREGLLGAAQRMSDWKEVADPGARCGAYVASTSAGLQMKWNIEGTGFQIWAPAGPDYGSAEVLVNGKSVGTLDTRRDERNASAPRFKMENLAPGRHTVMLITGEETVAVDCLEVVVL